MEVFISWSGDASRRVAESLSAFVEHVVKDVSAFISTQDIEAGERWESRLSEQLERSHHAVLCVTRDNQNAPWLHYEAGALGKMLGRAKVIPYTLNFPPNELDVGPLSRLQGVQNDEAGTWRLVWALSRASERGKDERFVREGFTMWWPQFREEMSAALSHAPLRNERPAPSDRDLLLEMRVSLQRLLDLAASGTTNVGAVIETLENALRDPLTQLPNRRALHLRGSQLTAARTSYVIGLVDLDNFKRVNDEFGHIVGDQLLSAVGTMLKEQLQSAGMVARLGGDEFGMIFQDIAPEKVRQALSEIRTDLSEISGAGRFHGITLSGGVSADQVNSIDEKLREAERAMSDAKQGGGNEVKLA